MCQFYELGLHEFTWFRVDLLMSVSELDSRKCCWFLDWGSAVPLENSYLLLGRDSAQLEFEAEVSSTTSIEWVWHLMFQVEDLNN